MHQTWKDEIANRLQNRVEKRELFEVLLNQIGRNLAQLLEELASEYHIEAKSIEQGESLNTKWTIKIEDKKYILDLNTAAQYYQRNNNLKEALIEVILDNFKFVD